MLRQCNNTVGRSTLPWMIVGIAALGMGLLFPTGAFGQEQVINRTYTYATGSRSLANGDWGLEYGGAYWNTLYTPTLTEALIEFTNGYGGEDYPHWGAYVWNCPRDSEVITQITYSYVRYGYLDTFHIALFNQDRPILGSGYYDGNPPAIKWQLSGSASGTHSATFSLDEGITSVGLGFYDTLSSTGHQVYFYEVTVVTTQTVKYQSYAYRPGSMALNNGDWRLKYGGAYWTTLFTPVIDTTSIYFANTYPYGGEDYPHWDAYVWNVPSDKEVIIGIAYHYDLYSDLESFHAALFAEDHPILSSGFDNGSSPVVAWQVYRGEPLGHTIGTQTTAFDLDDGIKCIGLGSYDNLSDNNTRIGYDNITVTTAKPVRNSTYSYSPGARPMNNGDWTLNFGGRYWGTLFAPTLTNTSIQFANKYGGEDYANWGAYVWNVPWYKEILTDVEYSYYRNGYLEPFYAALFADDTKILGADDNAPTPPVKWSAPGPGLVQGAREDSFNESEKISSIGLGFFDTLSSLQHSVSFSNINIKTTQADFATPYPVRPPLAPDQFVTVNNGHLSYNGQRLRIWGVNIVSAFHQDLADLELMFDRLVDLGFNALRINLFESTFLQNQNQNTWHVEETTIGDTSFLGRLDYAVYLAKQRGMFFWFTFDRLYYPILPGDYDVLPDDGHRTEWVAMITGSRDYPTLVYLDDRMQALHTAYAKAILNHVNPYTGKRYADEEAIALWEIFNENPFLRVFNPQNTDQGTFWNGLPAYIKEKVRVKWNTWLIGKYGNQTNLNNAWKINVLTPNMYSGETLTSQNVRFDNGPQHTGQRPRDIMEFDTWLYNDYNQRFISTVRAEAASGIGVHVVPFTPTGQGRGDLLPWYGAQMCGDFISAAEYGMACQKNRVDVNDPGYPFLSYLKTEPGFNTPIDLMRVQGKPYLIYESNDFRPNPYGVEFPIRVATQLAWQDADGVICGSAWDDKSYIPSLRRDEDYGRFALPMPDANYPNAGLFLANDEVQQAAIKSAGALFLYGNLPAAPLTLPGYLEWTCGKNHLFDPAGSASPSWNTLQSYLRYYAWRNGLRITYNPAVNSSSVPAYPLGNSVSQGSCVTYDWNDTDPGTLKINTPAVKALVGFIGPTETIGDTTISNINRSFSSFVMASQDGQPLASSTSILITMVSDSNNTGYSFNPANLLGVDDPMELVRGLNSPGGSPGTAPVVAQRVSGTIAAPWMAGMTYRKVGFDRRCYSQGPIDQDNPTFTVTANEPLFYARLIRPDSNAASYVNISGRVTLNNFAGNVDAIPVTITLRDQQGYLVEQRTLNLDGNGNYGIHIKSRGYFDVYAKASHWLSQKQININTTSDVAVNFSLVNGDCDGDNEVTGTDLAVILAAMDSISGSPYWDFRADLDGNGIVSGADLSINLINMDLAGN